MRWIVVSAVVLSAMSVSAQDRRADGLIGLPDLRPRVAKLRTAVHDWTLTGSRPDAYELRCDDLLEFCDLPLLRSKAGTSEPFGTGSLTHSESARPWRGARVMLRAELKAGRIGGWAGLWMRIDRADGQVLAFDNMQNRPIRGTKGFEWHAVVLDVPADAERISFGILLRGPGAIFIKEIQFDEASSSEAVTDLVAPIQAAK